MDGFRDPLNPVLAGFGSCLFLRGGSYSRALDNLHKSDAELLAQDWNNAGFSLYSVLDRANQEAVGCPHQKTIAGK